MLSFVYHAALAATFLGKTMTSLRSVPVSRLYELLEYDALTGVFTWKKQKKQAGHARHDGYLQIRVDGCLLYGHRIALAMVNKSWPEKIIDHLDGNPANNAYSNLREVSRLANQQNMRKAQKSSKSGLLGASPYRNKWRATIYINKKQKLLGYFTTAEEAHAVYLAAKRKMHEGCTI